MRNIVDREVDGWPLIEARVRKGKHYDQPS